MTDIVVLILLVIIEDSCDDGYLFNVGHSKNSVTFVGRIEVRIFRFISLNVFDFMVLSQALLFALLPYLNFQ
jgi:hypothetical protein